MMRWLLLSLSLLAGPVAACSDQTDCVVGDRIYRISGVDKAANGALVFAHGYRGSAAGVMRNGALRRLADEMGVALVGLEGVNGSWQLPGRPRNRNATGEVEFDYVTDVLADVETRFGLNRDRTVATGFSAGGMLVWNLACYRSDLFAGYIPMSGTFWDPVPQTCAGPVANVVHIHGTSDKTVPLSGRAIGDGRQGDVMAALEMYRDFGQFGPATADEVDGVLCEMSANDEGKTLSYCRFEGGHSFRLKDLRVGWDMLLGARE
ncbi:polyhydroxybutyrate depolymerase [Cognatiyoonia koreensis]|uniref:Polyhydroxybutyrate depolymerase n=1 Tax=Cognatiyoonia koreensis TaxID=364200 RepID=A0A1I0QAS5_9RHOB|nr:alpha/beta hydrolase-fold protein [Cognatiyoonia koreensis]SEW23682.1 polyhydroxybutyrate depolymerase [Cognatiyoonia koreensis]